MSHARERTTGRLRRSELATPASNDWMFESAMRSSADLVFLDLEDATAEDQKADARRKVVRALRELDWCGKVRAVRINHPATTNGVEDLEAVIGEAGAFVDVIVVPKLCTATEVAELSERMTRLERSAGVAAIELEVLIETAQALQNVGTIASAAERVGALTFGAGDFSADVHARFGSGYLPYDASFDVWHAVRWQVLVAARAAGIRAIDTPLPTFGDDNQLYRRQALQAYHMGFDGKWAIHPSQCDAANACFTPSPEDVQIAAEVVATYDDALARGLGATSYHGNLLDVGNVASARKLLASETRAGVEAPGLGGGRP